MKQADTTSNNQHNANTANMANNAKNGNKNMLETASQKIASATSIKSLEQVRAEYFAKKSGIISGLMENLRHLPVMEKKEKGKQYNIWKQEIATMIEARQNTLKEQELAEQFAKDFTDVTLPSNRHIGSLHPITKTIEEIQQIFAPLGFDVAQAREIEDDFHNFQALNFPKNHPAREMQDTFFIDGKSPENNEDLLLRTHTSSVQIRYMLANKPPYKIISPGKTFRCDSDATHSPMFHQIEGLYVDKGVNMAMLREVLTYFIARFFGTGYEIRFRPSFFPFTEPSAEVDIGVKQQDGSIKYMEVLGCGMVHPNVLKNVGVATDIYQGYAFGMGVERLAMLKYGITDLRSFFDGNIKWQKHYGNI